MHAYSELEKQIEEEDVILVVCSTVLEELDKHKDGNNGEKKFLSRKALKLINSHPSNVRYVVDEVPNPYIVKTLFFGFDMDAPDNKILYACRNFMDEYKNLYVDFVTNDNGLVAKAHMLNIPVIKMAKSIDDELYKGYIELYGTEEENDNALLELLNKPEQLHANQYIILHDSDTGADNAVRWDAKEQDFVDIKYNSKKIKPLNIYQACAMDLMYNDNVPIKIIMGLPGSGKSMIGVTMAEERIYTGLYDRLLLVRNPIAVDGFTAGYLPGGWFEKLGKFYNCMTQYLTNDSMYESSEFFDPKNEEAQKRRGYLLEMEAVQDLKGISVDRTIIIADEAEDLSIKLIKCLGTRVGKGSELILLGDLKQAENQYKVNNGIATFIEHSLDSPLVGVVWLPEDVRSEMSKLFAEL
jgi:predicted ribonuclease YlaK